MKSPIKIAVIVDLGVNMKDCLLGLQYLEEMEAQDKLKMVGFYKNNVRYNMTDVQRDIHYLLQRVDVLIIDDKLALFCDYYLRYDLRNSYIKIVDVFGDSISQAITEASGANILFVPNLTPETEEFLQVCKYVAENELPRVEIVDREDQRHSAMLSLKQAIAEAEAEVKKA